jgi:hypothetical protein
VRITAYRLAKSARFAARILTEWSRNRPADVALAMTDADWLAMAARARRARHPERGDD